MVNLVYRYFRKQPYRLPVALSIIGLFSMVGYCYSVGYHLLCVFVFSFLFFFVLTIYLILNKCLKDTQQNKENLNNLHTKKGQLTHTLDKEESLLEAKDQQMQAVLKTLKETQQQLIMQEKMASIGMLTAGIAHEIKNPLNFINNFSETTIEILDELKEALKKNTPVSEEKLINELIEEISMNCQKIAEHGKRAESIIKNMLIQSGNHEQEAIPSDINALLEEYLNLAYHGMRAQNNSFNAKLEKQFDTAIEKIILSPQSVGRVFLNIINNALYAANEKGKECLEKGIEFMPTVTIKTEQDKDNVIIHIKDNGNGIPEKLQKKIFEPFFTTKPAGLGTGLGLPICHKTIVEEHGGNLTIRSQPGAYSEFIICIPKKQQEQ